MTAVAVYTEKTHELITCDGCGIPVEELTDDMYHPLILPHLWKTSDPEAEIRYIVCPPLSDGSQPCLERARQADLDYEAARCKIEGCNGDRCSPARAAWSRVITSSPRI